MPITTTRLLDRNWPAGGGGYFRLLPYRGVALVDPPRQRGRRAAGDLLLPPVGARPDAAARRGRQPQDALPPLPEPRIGRSGGCAGCSAISTGAASTACFCRGGVMARPAVIPAKAGISSSPGPAFAGDDHGSHEARATELPSVRDRDCAFAGRSRPRTLGRVRRALSRGDVLPPRRLAGRSSNRCSGTGRIYLLAERDGEVAGVLPLAQVKSLAVRALARLAAVLRLRRRRGDRPGRGASAARRGLRRSPASSASIISSSATGSRASPTGRARTCTSPSARRSCPTSKRTCSRFRASSARWCARASSTGCAASSTLRSTASSRSTPTTSTATARRRCRSATSRPCSAFSARTARCSPCSTPDGQPVSSVLSLLLPRRGAALLRRRRRGGARPRRQRLQVLGADAPRVRARPAACSTTAAASAGRAPSTSRRTGGSSRRRSHYEYALLRGDRIPQNNPLNPKYRGFIAVWRRIPIGLANALGPHIVRHLG